MFGYGKRCIRKEIDIGERNGRKEVIGKNERIRFIGISNENLEEIR